MSLQIASIPDPNAIRALGNMAQVVDASEARLQLSNDEIFRTMKTTLEQSEVNNRTLSDRNTQLATENLALKQRIKELTDTNAAHQRTVEAQYQTKLDGIKVAASKMQSTCDQVIASANIIAQKPPHPGILGNNARCNQLRYILSNSHSPEAVVESREKVIDHTNLLKKQIAQIENL